LSFAPLTREVSSANGPDEEHESEAEEAADCGEEHVFVGVPRVALGAEEGHAEFASPDLRHGPFEEFVEEGRGHVEGEDEEVAPEGASGDDGVVKDFAKRQGEEEPVEKVDEAVEMIAARLDSAQSEGLEPLPVGHFGVGVVGSEGVEAEKEENEAVGEAGEDKATGREDEKEEPGGDEDVLEPPVGRMLRGNREGYPPDCVETAEEKKEATMRRRERAVHGGFVGWLTGKQDEA
jgi:hypothetical protein